MIIQKGTDIVDQKISSYLCKTKSRKRTKFVLIFSYLLDTYRIRAIKCISNEKTHANSHANQIGLKLALVLFWNKKTFHPKKTQARSYS